MGQSYLCRQHRVIVSEKSIRTHRAMLEFHIQPHPELFDIILIPVDAQSLTKDFCLFGCELFRSLHCAAYQD
jgi:hypothetical protein